MSAFLPLHGRRISRSLNTKLTYLYEKNRITIDPRGLYVLPSAG
jgi:hypothetical protein